MTGRTSTGAKPSVSVRGITGAASRAGGANRFKLVRGVGSEFAGKPSHSALSAHTTIVGIVQRILIARLARTLLLKSKMQ